MTEIKNANIDDFMRPIHALVIFQKDDNLHHYVTKIQNIKFKFGK